MAGTADVIARLSVWLGIDTAAFEKGADIGEKRLAKMQREFTKLGEKMQDIGKAMSVAVTVPLAGAGAAVLKFSGDFESSMIKLSISSQATSAELKQMNELALQLGKDTTFGASEAANAMDELAKSGLSAQQILDGAATAAVNLATATGSELSPAANAITDTIKQFGLSTSQLPDAVNQITGAVNQSKLDFQDYALAIGQAGGVAGGLGVDFKDFNTTLAATSSLFASGSDAGTSFKTFLTSLTGNSKQAKGAIDQFGLSFFDANGNLRTMAEIAEELRTKLGGLSEQAKSEVLKDIFGTDAMRTAIGLMNQGAEGLDRVAAAIAKTDAAAQSAQRMKGFYGQLENLKGAIETLAIRVGQSGVLEAVTVLVTKIADLVDWLSTASPGVLQFAAVIGAIAAAIGPVVFAVGTLTSAFAPLFVIVSTRVIPAFALFKLELAALAVAGGPAAVAMRILTVALRGLMIATGVGLAITAVAAAIYLLTRRTNESVPAAQAYSRALNTAQQTAKDARVASDNLAQAMGREREAALKAAMAQRELAAQRLKAAQARIIDAEAAARSSTAAAKLAADRTRVAANDPRLIPGIDRTGADFRKAQAQSNLKAAESAVITLTKAKADLDRSIAAALAPVNLPGVNSGGGAAAVADRAAGSVDRLGKTATAAATPLRDLFDQLFPAEADMREAGLNLDLLKKALDSGKISAERYSDAVTQLWRNFLGASGPPEGQIESVLGGDTIGQISERISDRFADTLERLGNKAGATKVQVVKTFKEMADETLAAFSRLSDAIQGGGFLSILEAVAGLGLQLGSIGLFGKNVQTSINKTPGFANGTSFAPGGWSIVGERGPELVDLPRGARVTPNNDLRGMGGSIAQIVPSPYFDVVVDGRIISASPAIMDGSAKVTTSRLGRRQTRRLRG